MILESERSPKSGGGRGGGAGGGKQGEVFMNTGKGKKNPPVSRVPQQALRISFIQINRQEDRSQRKDGRWADRNENC